MGKLKLPRIYKPYLDFAIYTGWIDLRTEVWKQSVERYEFTYLSLYWRIFKWNGRFRLYKPGEDFNPKAKRR